MAHWGGAAAVSSGRITPANRAAFGCLTEYADILLTNGDVNIYSAAGRCCYSSLIYLAWQSC